MLTTGDQMISARPAGTVSRGQAGGHQVGTPGLDSGGKEDRANQRLENERVHGSAHDRKQRTVGCDNDRHDRIEGPVAIEADAGSE